MLNTKSSNASNVFESPIRDLSVDEIELVSGGDDTNQQSDNAERKTEGYPDQGHRLD